MNSYYSVEFVYEYATIRTVVIVPHHDNEEDYDGDDSAIDVAYDLLMSEYGWDLSSVKAIDINVELEGVQR